jgi:hypothetical protein
MKKIFLLIAVLCCGVMGVKADNLPDGLTIKIGNSYVSTDSYRNITGGVLTSGTIFYDVENRVLKLYSVNATWSATYPLVQISGGTKPVKIEVYGYCQFYTDGVGANCMEISTPVIISGQSSGATLLVGSKNNRGIVLKADMTVQDGVEMHVSGSSYSIIGELKDSKYPKITVDGCRIIASGTTSGIQDVSGVDLIDSELDTGITWSESDLCFKKGGSTCDEVVINRDANMMGYTYLYSREPEFGGKLSILKDGVEQSIPFKNNTSDYIMVELKAEDNDKFAFDSFSGIGATNPVDYSAGYDAEFVADWTYKLKSDKPWYVLDDKQHMHKFTDHMGTTNDLGEVGGIKAENYMFGTAARLENKNRLLYACQATVLKQNVKARDFEESDVSSTDSYGAIITMQEDYELCAMTYSDMTKELYYAAKSKDDAKYYLLSEDPDNAGKLKPIASLGSFGIDKPVTCMATDKWGYLYLITEDATNASMYVIGYFFNNFFIGTKLCDLGYGSKGVNALGFDPYTDEMIWLQNDGNYYRTIRVIDADTRRPYRVADITMNPTGMFQLYDVHKVSVAVDPECEDKGDVSVPYYNSYGNYAEGCEVTITAKPNDYCRFVKWKEDGNTEAERKITVGSEDKTYTAVFDYEEGITAYPVWIDGKQVHSGRLTFDSYNSNLGGGYISYDPNSHTLTMTKVSYDYDEIKQMIRVGEDGSDLKELTIRLEGSSTFKQKNAEGVVFQFDHVDAKFTGSGSLKTECQNSSSAIALNHSNLTFEGVEANIQANKYGIQGTGGDYEEEVTVRGSDLKVQGGGGGSIVTIGALNMEYCEMSAPTGAAFNESLHSVVVSGLPTKDQVVFSPWPKIIVEPEETGTGKFFLKAGDAEFENVGWFKDGTTVTIQAVPADGFEFARWKHDMLWGDEEKINDWKGETITYDKTSGTDELTALFYYIPESSATWYAVNQNSYISFEMSDRGAHYAKASGPSASDVRCGDYRDDMLEYYTNQDAKTMPFDGVTDKEAMSGKDNIEKLFSVSSWTIYDASYDMENDVMYAISSGSLYRVNHDKKQLDLVGALYLNGSLESGRCLAVDAEGIIYVLIYDFPYARLCTVVNIDEELNKVEIEPVGGYEGSTGHLTSSFQHAIAFDHATGELFWGAEDYIRKFDLSTGRAYICGDLGRQRGGQGVMTAMHRMSHYVNVYVKVDEDCESCGTVSVNNGGRFIEGQKVTITAKEKEGYQFLYWQRKGSSKEIETNPYSFSAGSNNATYVAYFKKKKKPEEGLDDVLRNDVPCTKVLIDGNLYIERDGKVYSVTGNRVK